MESTGFDFDTESYLRYIVATNERFARALEHLGHAHEPELGYLSAEEFALQVRMICESILSSSFIVHRRRYAMIIGAITDQNLKPSRLVKELATLNSGFMPRAVSPHVSADGAIGHTTTFSDQINAGFMIRVHGICGHFVHIPSRTRKVHKLSDFREDFDRFLRWMNLYLAGHAISFFKMNRTFLFDGAGKIAGVPRLYSLEESASQITFTLEGEGLAQLASHLRKRNKKSIPNGEQ